MACCAAAFAAAFLRAAVLAVLVATAGGVGAEIFPCWSRLFSTILFKPFPRLSGTGFAGAGVATMAQRSAHNVETRKRSEEATVFMRLDNVDLSRATELELFRGVVG